MRTVTDRAMPIRAEIACPCGWVASRLVEAPEDAFLWDLTWQSVHDAIREDAKAHLRTRICPFGISYGGSV